LILELGILIRNTLAVKAFKLIFISYFPPLPYPLRVNRLPPAQDDPDRPPPSHQSCESLAMFEIAIENSTNLCRLLVSEDPWRAIFREEEVHLF
jgi:hypothetical protein